MRKIISLFGSILAIALTIIQLQSETVAINKSNDLTIQSAAVTYSKDMDLLVFEQKLNGKIGTNAPKAIGQLDGAPVLGYVFPTTLKSEDVGFNSTDGIVALAATYHPDFDDTPLWDENNDGNYTNDKTSWHTHWVLLTKDTRVVGGLSVKQFKKENAAVILPPTNPGMPMYMDSPGFSTLVRGNSFKILVPAQRVHNKIKFKYDAVAALMNVNTSKPDRPMLGVSKVYSVLSQKLTLPYSVQNY
jgi:hypothetical protein